VRLRTTGIHPDEHPIKTELVCVLAPYYFSLEFLIWASGWFGFDVYCVFYLVFGLG
jgi:hypothetical protein